MFLQSRLQQRRHATTISRNVGANRLRVRRAPPSWRIMASTAKWLTAKNPPYSTGRTRNGSVFFDRLNEVAAATWLETALPPHDGAKRPLIDSDAKNQQACRKLPKPVCQRLHLLSPMQLTMSTSHELKERLLYDRHRRRGLPARDGHQIDARR